MFSRIIIIIILFSSCSQASSKQTAVTLVSIPLSDDNAVNIIDVVIVHRIIVLASTPYLTDAEFCKRRLCFPNSF